MEASMPSVLVLVLCLAAVLRGAGALRTRTVRASVPARRGVGRLWAEGGSDKKPAGSKNTGFERGLSDFIGKRYGAGEAFYGKRLSDQTEEEYQQAQSENNKPLWDDEAPLRRNAILVVGGATSVGQWVVFDLVEKGFAVRVATVDRKEAINVFGLPGLNVDVLPPLSSSDEAGLEKALSGAQAVVLCCAFDCSSSRARDEAALASRLLQGIEERRAAGRGELDVRKIVCLSRVVPREWGLAEAGGSGVLGGLSRVLRAITGGSNSGSPEAQALHAGLEARVRDSGLDYVVVRAPPDCDESREGAREDLLLLQGPEAGPKPADFARRVAAVSSSGSGLGIGHLDLAEAAVQALVQDVSAVTFTACADPAKQVARREEDESRPLIQSAAMDAVYGPAPPRVFQGDERARRASYYGILEMADADMRTTYLLRGADALRAQLAEDSTVEDYWAAKLAGLERDRA